MADRIYRSIFGFIAFSLLLLAGCVAMTDHQGYADGAYVDDVEYLSEYGEWLYHPDYGDVWLPYVIPDWRPFYHGNWVWTGTRWSWTSYEPFGWLVYHYGYWGFDPGMGWFWVPDDVWEPARVEWYTFGAYTAWAPLPPPGIRWPGPWDPYEIDIWIVVDREHFIDEDIGRYVVKRPVYAERSWFADTGRQAPDIREIERVTKTTVPVIRTRERATNIRSRADSARTATRRRIDLPKDEKRKVERNEPRVKREVLRGREETPEKKTDPKRKRR